MFAIIFLYAVLAFTFVLAKLAVGYAHPFLIIALRMMTAGAVLLGTLAIGGRERIQIQRGDEWIFLRVAFFHIYLAFCLEFMALRSLSSAMTNLIYSTTPFITALLSYILLGERMGWKKVFALVVGLMGLLPMMADVMDTSTSLSACGWLCISVTSSAYAWFDIRHLMHRGYSLVWINAFAMGVGGVLALATGVLWWGEELFHVRDMKMLVGLLSLMVILSNGIFYHLYGWLMQRYTLTFLNFAGFLSPLFGLMYGAYLLHEPIDRWVGVSFLLISCALYLFYTQERRES